MNPIQPLTALSLLAVLSSITALAQHEGHGMPEGMMMPSDHSTQPTVNPNEQVISKYVVDDQENVANKFGIEPIHDNMLFYTFRGDRFEYRSFDEGEAYLWDVRGWIGRDYNKLFFESEGEYSIDEDTFESVETRLLYGRAISNFWDFRAGLRYDFDPEPERAYAVIGLLGLAPQWFEVDANLYLSENGDLSFRVETEYDFKLTQRLILQPRLELEVAAQDVNDYAIGAGFTGVELDLRLRYEISRKFAPYIGVSWESALGETANLIESGGGDPDTFAFVAGVKFWF